MLIKRGKFSLSRVTLILLGLIISIGLLISADGAWAGVVIENANGFVNALVDFGPMNFRSGPNFKRLTGLGSVGTSTSFASILGPESSAGASISIVPLENGIEFTGTANGSATWSSALGIAQEDSIDLVLQIDKPKLVTLEIELNALIELSGLAANFWFDGEGSLFMNDIESINSFGFRVMLFGIAPRFSCAGTSSCIKNTIVRS